VRVLHVIQEMGPGGAERVVVTLAAQARRAGHEVAVASSPGSLEAEFDGLRFEMPLIRRDVRKLPSAVAALASIVRRWSPDILHCHNPTMGLVAAVATGRGAWRPALVSVHGVPEEDYERSSRILRLTGFMSVACGPGVEAALREHGVRRARTIVNGVSPAPPPATRQELLDRFGIPVDVPLVAAAGRLAPQKDHATAIRALAALPWASLILIGDGPLREPLDRLISDLGLGERVHRVGAQPEARRFIGTADSVVISSRWEGLPLVALEALAAGVPLVATDVRGNRELLRDGHDAVLIPPGDPTALARAIEGCLLDDARRGDLVAGGLRTATLYTEERMYSGFSALYRELLGARRKRRPRHPVADGDQTQRGQTRSEYGRRPHPVDDIAG
jgi:glycosyltransferase involved in cell wall biosynthesis